MTTATFDIVQTRSTEPRETPPTPAVPLATLLVRADDRLLRDIGLTRHDVLGVDGVAREALRANRDLWRL